MKWDETRGRVWFAEGQRSSPAIDRVGSIEVTTGILREWGAITPNSSVHGTAIDGGRFGEIKGVGTFGAIQALVLGHRWVSLRMRRPLIRGTGSQGHHPAPGRAWQVFSPGLQKDRCASKCMGFNSALWRQIQVGN